ncbi:MAG: efflux RND transporter periplasmic adaptor subunit [Propionibacteriaceae bacterium]|nr:efflux RND transporter periplasmic adaptor subunit [Propionibacteriaceae bacterium]
MVQTAAVEYNNLSETVGLEGTLSPAVTANLSFSVSGTVTKVYVKVGEQVAKGDKLAAVSKDDLQDAVTLAKANLTSAKADYTDAKSNGTSAQIKSAKAQVAAAEASLATAKSNLSDAVLKSTIDGTIAEVNVSVGDTIGGQSSSSGASMPGDVSSSSAAFLILDTSAWQVEGTVSAADVSQVKSGQTVAVTVGEDLTPVAGTVAAVGMVATSSMDGQATFPVTVTIDEPNESFYSGTTASAQITVSESGNVLTVPTAAVLADGDQTYVTMADGSTRDITIGKTVGDLTEVTDGLAEGEEVQYTSAFAGVAADDSGQFTQGMGGMGGIGMGGSGITVVTQSGGGGTRRMQAAPMPR